MDTLIQQLTEELLTQTERSQQLEKERAELSRLYHSQRERMLELEGVLQEIIHLIEIAPETTFLDAQEVWKSCMQESGRHAKQLLSPKPFKEPLEGISGI